MFICYFRLRACCLRLPMARPGSILADAIIAGNEAPEQLAHLLMRSTNLILYNGGTHLALYDRALSWTTETFLLGHWRSFSQDNHVFDQDRITPGVLPGTQELAFWIKPLYA
jgi:hypothetical protein